jgi:hypothetical protein
MSGNPVAINVLYAGSSGTTILGNKIGVNAAGTAALPNGTGVGLYSAGSARIANNWIANNSGNGVNISSDSTAVGPSNNNCIAGNNNGVVNANATPPDAPFTGNWWGAADGPGGFVSGSGDSISDGVEYDPYLTTAPAACTILKNASFETDANHDLKPDNWTFASFDAATDKRDCAVRQSGTCSLKLVGNGIQKTASQTVIKSGIAGDHFTFSLWSKGSSVPAGSLYRLQVKFYNGSTLLSTQTMNFANGTHGFSMKSGTFTASTTYTKVVYKIFFKAASGTAWFDVAGLSWAP